MKNFLSKKILAVVLVVITLLSCGSISVFAADEKIIEYPFNICYDEETCRVYNKNGKGFMFGFDYDKDDEFWFTPLNPWQRRFGYSKAYDDLAFLAGCYIDTVRVCFEYNDKEWLVQYWKGIYGYTSGAEIGVYNRPIGSKGSFYKCISDEEMPKMSLTVKVDGEVFFAQPQQKHWWMTGFVLPSRHKAGELYCEMSIDMGDKKFSNLLYNGLIEQGFSAGNTVKMKNTEVKLVW